MKTKTFSLLASVFTLLAAVACSTEEDASLGKDKNRLSNEGSSGAAGSVSQGAELCNGIDDDQDGQVDEDASCGAGETCQNGACTPAAAGCTSDADCAAGQVCAAGQCSAPQGAELCNGIDDDQDGQVDEEASCGAGQICKDGSCVQP